MPKAVQINDTQYGPEEVLDHREVVIQLRDSALAAGQMEWALHLSITVALLQVLASELNGDYK